MNQPRIKHFFIRIALVLLIMISSISAAFVSPQKAHAQLAVVDAFNGVFNSLTSVSTAAEKLQGYVLNPLAWALEKAVLQSVVNSTVKWVNSGFNGSPAFATNLNKTLQQVGDAQANSFIQQLQSNGSIKSPFQTQVASAVSTNYLQSTSATSYFTQNPFTLGTVSSNPTAFLAGGSSGFAQGGFNALLSTAMNSGNNPYGATILANQALNTQVAGAQNTQKTELQWGNGFLSYRGNCQTPTTGKSTTGINLTSLTGNSGCQSQNIITPGGAISSSLYKSLGSGVDTLVTASQFNELVGALMSQLINHVLGGGGLFGLTQSSASTGGTTYFNQTEPAATQSVDGGTIDASVAASFSETLTGQLTQLQTFQSEWNSIDAAAQSAAASLESNPCANNESVLSNVVEPVISQATTELSNANTSITALTSIQNETPAANSTAASTAQIAQASSDYSTFLASATVPSDSDISYAATQSITTGTSTPPSLYSEMNEIAQAAPACNAASVPAAAAP
jgi:hypothetical protein